MRALSLCQACKRHIRVTESACPFCGAAFTLVEEPTGLKPRGRPGGRAALFLVGTAGTAVAPGCADEPDREMQVLVPYGILADASMQSIPPYGVAIPVQPDAGGRDAGGPMVVPVYGVAVYGVPPGRDGGVDANVCGDPQVPMAVPVYGVALDGVPLVGPKPRDPDVDASLCGQDAGRPADAGHDAQEPIPVVPPYGIAIDDPVDGGRRDARVMPVPVYGLWSETDPQEDE